MFEYKKMSKNELEQVIKNASLKIGVNEVILEKDYWVCFVLNYLFSKCKWKEAFTFKGGTSLSKCFNLIHRFSEDIDLILDWRVIGYSFDEPWQERSNTKQDKFNKETILIDTGGRLALPQESWQKPQSQTNAEKTLIPYLESVGVSQIDQLILTHTDADHVGDFLNLADKIKIKEIWVSPGELTNNHFVQKLKKANIAIHISKVGDKIPIFDSALQVLSNGYTGKGDNNDSIVTYGNFYHTKFLFTGDLEQEGEKELLKNYPKLKVDVLKVGHHGSKTSSSPDFIKEINPKLALISVGKENRYGHPNQETLETLKKYQIRILRTDQKGALKLMQINQQWRIQTVR